MLTKALLTTLSLVSVACSGTLDVDPAAYVHTYSDATKLALTCGTDTAWAEPTNGGWFAVCGNAAGSELFKL